MKIRNILALAAITMSSLLIGETSLAQQVPRHRTGTRGRIVITNKCNSTVRILVGYYNLAGNMRTSGFWTVKPGKTNYVPNSMTEHSYVYFYATNRTHTWSNPNYFITHNGVTYDAVRFFDNDGDTEINLTCP